MQNIHNICINYAYMRAKSEGELLHTVKGFLQMIQSNGTRSSRALQNSVSLSPVFSIPGNR